MTRDNKILMPLIYIPCLLVNKLLNNDFWFLINSGRYVMEHGVPFIEPFTIHKNMNFVMQQWLSSVIYWLVYDIFGEYGIYIVIMICFGISIFIMYKLTFLISNCNFFVSFILTILFGDFLRSYIITRPMTFTILFILVELYSLEMYINTQNNKYLLILPILSSLMINFHAAMWPILFLLILPYVADYYYTRIEMKYIYKQAHNNIYLFKTIILMLIFAFINPYGLDAMTYLFKSYGYAEISETVSEMLPPNINNLTGIKVFSLIFLIMLIYLIYRNGKSKVRYFLLSLGTCIMALSSVRSFPFFVICGLFPLAFYLKDFNFEVNVVNNKISKFRIILIACIVVLTLFVVIMDVNKVENRKFLELNEAINYLLKNEDMTNAVLYTGYNDGGLTEYKGIPSYIDPRAEVFVKKNNGKEDIMKEYVDLRNGDLYYKIVLDKYNFTHLLVSKKDILGTYLPYDKDYEVLFSNESYIVFKKIPNECAYNEEN
jgi:hypothetical protein